jgi:hypothetical protein
VRAPRTIRGMLALALAPVPSRSVWAGPARDSSVRAEPVEARTESGQFPCKSGAIGADRSRPSTLLRTGFDGAQRERSGVRRLLPLLFAALALLAACNNDGGDGPTPTATPTADEILDQAADRMEALESCGLAREHQKGTTQIVRGVQMETASGMFDVPERLQAEVAGRAGPLNTKITFIVVGNEAWMTNPLTGRFERIDATPEPLARLVTEVPALIRGISGAQITGSDEVDGAEAWVIEADVEAERLTFLVPGAEARTVRAKAWIGKEERYLHRLEVSGPLTNREPENILRRLRLSDFDQDFDIQPPR